MTSADIAWLVGELFAAYATGWCCGWLQLQFKRAGDKL